MDAQTTLNALLVVLDTNLFGPFLKTLNIWIKSDVFNFKVNNVDDGMICAGVDQGGDSQYLMLMAMVEVERLMMVVAKLERMQSRMHLWTLSDAH